MSKDLQKYKNPLLKPEERADDLLGRMSLEEKLGQIQCFNPASWSNDCLEKDYPHGVGEVSFLIADSMETKEEAAEALRGIQNRVMTLSEHNVPAIFHIETLCGGMMPEAVSFPSGIGRASSWNPDLEKKTAGIISRQVRAVGVTHAFAPVLDVSRDPRFGRQGETYGEDPTLASSMGTAYVNGMQNGGNLKTGVMAASKHFLAYANTQGGIHAASSETPFRLLREVYAKPFQAAIKYAGLKSVMNAYSAIDGEPAAGSKSLLTGLLRDEMGFTGLTVADYCSVGEMMSRQRVCATKTEAGVRALSAGLDVEMPSKDCYGEGLLELIKSGLVDAALLDRSVKRVLTAKFELGLFEKPYPGDEEDIQRAFACPEASDTSLEAAKESLVLLKNDGTLPLKRSVKKIAVIGHHAASSRILFGGYSFISMQENMLCGKNTMAGVDMGQNGGENSELQRYPGSGVEVENPLIEIITRKFKPNAKTLLEVLKQKCPDAQISYSYGYPYAGDDVSGHEKALAAAENADAVIITLGGKYGWGTTSSTGEGIDSSNINLPKCQEIFLDKLAVLGKPVVAVHFDGRPISSDAADACAGAIIEAWSPGEFGAEAVASVIFGDYNPGGKLPVSVAYNAGQIPVFYGHENGAGYHTGTLTAFHSYVDMPHTPRYFFGFGLSYTRFEYSRLKLNKKEFGPGEEILLTVDVKNTGGVGGDEVVQVYISDRYASVVRPVKELAGFKRIALDAGEKRTVVFKMKSSQFAFLDADKRWKIEAGDMDVAVGSSSEDIRLRDDFKIRSDLFIGMKDRSFFAQTAVL